MNPIALLVFVAVAVLVLVVLSGRTRRGGGRTPVAYSYGPQHVLFTAAERSFLGALEQTVGESYRIFGKVRLADVIQVNAGLTRSTRQVAFNRITGKHLDFVLCDPTDLTVVVAIELDDKSHEAASRKERDSFVDAALGAAGIPVHHFSAKHSYSVREIRTMLMVPWGASELPAGSGDAPSGPTVEDGGGLGLGRSSRDRRLVQRPCRSRRTAAGCRACGRPRHRPSGRRRHVPAHDSVPSSALG